MKLYLLTNMYCGGSHPGIQGIHSAVNLVAKYGFDERDFPELSRQIYSWVDTHQTVVLLQSGLDHQGLNALAESLDATECQVSFNRIKDENFKPRHPLVPFASFAEPGMNNTITSVAVLCDSTMVIQMDSLRKGLLTEDAMIFNYGDVLGNLLIQMAYMRLV